VLRSTELAEEVMQEVFARLWRQPDRFDPERGSLKSFLFCEAHGRAVDQWRSDTARRRREERALGGVGPDDVDVHGSDIEREVWDHVQAEKVREVLDGLPDTEREAILLAYFGGHTYREVATLMDQPEGTVKSRIRSGLRRLADALENAGYGARHDTR
jgi:RNA polymerase sigma-70 factor (ECF subfamily)